MLFGHRQEAEPPVFFASTGAATLAPLRHPAAPEGFEPAKWGAVTDIPPPAWPASGGTPSIGALALGITVACALVLALASVPSRISGPPDGLADGAGIDAMQARTLMDAGAAIVDTRPAPQYAQGRIAGALNAAYESRSANDPSFDPAQDRFDLSKLPADKAAPLVFYCAARACWTAYKASKAAAAAGYGNVNWLRGGLAEWIASGYPIATHDPRGGRTP